MTLALLSLLLTAEPLVDEQLFSGRWVDSELNVVSEVKRAPDGTWSGTVVSSPQPKDVGKTTFQRLIWDPKKKRFSGKLVKPDDGQVVDLDLTITSANSLTGEAGFFIFRKTLKFSRGLAPDAG